VSVFDIHSDEHVDVRGDGRRGNRISHSTELPKKAPEVQGTGLRRFKEWLNLWRRAEISDAASTFTTFTTVTTVGSARGPETLGSFLDPP